MAGLNADDYYGKVTVKAIYNQFAANTDPDGYCMVAFENKAMGK